MKKPIRLASSEGSPRQRAARAAAPRNAKPPSAPHNTSVTNRVQVLIICMCKLHMRCSEPPGMATLAPPARLSAASRDDLTVIWQKDDLGPEDVAPPSGMKKAEML